jgi:hypothetical protein
MTNDEEITTLHRRVSLLVFGYVVFAVSVVVALFVLGILIKSIHTAQESHFQVSSTERALIIQQNGEVLDALRGGKE